MAGWFKRRFGGGVLVALLSAVALLFSGQRFRAYAQDVPGDSFGYGSTYEQHFGRGGDVREGLSTDKLLDMDESVIDRNLNSQQTGLVGILAKVRGALALFLRAVLALAALGTLAVAVLQLSSGDQGAAKRMFMWLIGLSVCFVLLVLFGGSSSSLVFGGSTVVPDRGTGFGALRLSVGNIIESLLSIVAMVSLVNTSIHFMKGERDGAEKLFRWLIISVVGIVLLRVV